MADTWQPSRPRHQFTFIGGPRDGELAEYKRGDAKQQVWQGSVWCYTHQATLRMVWTEVPERLRTVQP
jgi:hypothetical protein